MASTAAGTWFNMRVLVRALLLIALASTASAAQPARRSASEYLFGSNSDAKPSLARRFLSEFYWGGRLITHPIARSAYEVSSDGPEAAPGSDVTATGTAPSYGGYYGSPPPAYGAAARSALEVSASSYGGYYGSPSPPAYGARRSAIEVTASSYGGYSPSPSPPTYGTY
ncbi:hypothetical protein Agub_g3010 [Astrephomene gubernaculifera]|uniref:Uncharacterized protein n=1 Tax=Astrephomene gubernaculifera TaxID=47775 RepID=A0AAD3DK77_9CHLO|nr:hypothetical protein Agub_g3010 [Astrephomene gubernaculifera]